MNKLDQLKKIIAYDGDQEIEIHRMTNNIWRVGFCSQCGACCKSITITAEVSYNVAAWLEGYNVVVKKQSDSYDIKDDEYQYVANLSFPVTCQYLFKETTTGKFNCDRYEKRPVICMGYPKKLSKWESCTFAFLNYDEVQWFLKSFEETDSGKEEKRRIIWR